MKRQQHFPPQPQQTLSAEQVQKQREYLKQQQKLRLMATCSHKGNPVSTETLIENLLGSKDTFQPVDVSTSNPPRSAEAPREASLPTWLSPQSPLFPPLYHHVWSMVGLPDGMVDTAKVYPLLLTSGLHLDILGFIWGLSNRQVPGTLTEQELYVLLALVALAQCGYTFNSASVLSLIPQPPVPNLNLGSESQLPIRQEPIVPQHTVASFSHLPMTSNQPTPSQTVFGQFSQASALTSSSCTDPTDADDFTDFQSASFPGLNTTNKTDVQPLQKQSESTSIQKKSSGMPISSPSIHRKAPDTSLTVDKSLDSKLITVQKFPTVAVVGGGRSIGSRLANHSLNTPKLTKSRHHKHHHHHHRSVPPEPACVSVDEEFSDFQQASPGEVPQPHPSHTYFLKESAIRVGDAHTVPRLSEPAVVKPPSPAPNTSAICVGDTQTVPRLSKPAILKPPTPALNTNTIHVGDTQTVPRLSEPAVVNPPTPVPNTSVTEDTSVLMGVEEDRYSALRALSASSDTPTVLEEEYGDFFSAAVPSIDDSVRADQEVPPWGAIGVVAPQTSKFQVDDWSLFMSSGDSAQDNIATTPNTLFNSSIISSKTESKVDMLSSHVADLNLTSLECSTPQHIEKETSVQPSLSPHPGQNIMALFSEVHLPLTSQSNTDSVTTNKNDDNDDFGDFVSPISFCEKTPVSESDQLGSFWQVEEGKELGNKLWLDESRGMDSQLWSHEVGKYDQVKLCRDGILDNPLVSNLWLEEGKAVDSQSVRSLELPGLEQAWDSVGEWRRCVQSCVSVLQFAVDTFESVTEPKVLQEVLTSSEGQEYLKGLVEVWAVCERLALSYRQSGTDHKLDALLNSAETMWVSLKPNLHQAQVSTESEEAVEGGELCGICLMSGAKVEFGGHTYHPSCGNLWLNLVDTTGLPALHIATPNLVE